MHTNESAVHVMMRAESYRFLAACFYQPKKEHLEAEGFFPVLIEDLQEVCPAAAPFARRMQEALAAQSEEELTVEYSRLFVGPFGLKVPPYGSIYLDAGRTVMGPSTQETIQFYEQEGLTRDEGFHELPDHIAVELEFLYYLTFRQAEALQKGDLQRVEEFQAKEEAFRGQFVDKWVPAFCKTLRDETESTFYSSLATCLENLLYSLPDGQD